MKEKLELLRAQAVEELSGLTQPSELETYRVKYLGKKGELTAILKQMGKLSAEERPVIGQLANEVRQELEEKIYDLQSYFSKIKNLMAIDPKYTILPLDEDYFEIDANSRKITVPEAFRKNGIAVKGD